MKSSLLALGGTSLAFASLDLGHKMWSEATDVHARSGVYVATVLLLAALWAGAILATRSLSLAVAGGVLAGGVLGNLASLAVWPGIPNPIELEPIAFNLADVFVLAGFAMTAVTMLVFAARNRDRLREPIRLR